MKTPRIVAYFAISAALVILASLLATKTTNPLLPMILLAVGIGFAVVGITVVLSRR